MFQRFAYRMGPNKCPKHPMTGELKNKYKNYWVYFNIRWAEYQCSSLFRWCCTQKRIMFILSLTLTKVWFSSIIIKIWQEIETRLVVTIMYTKKNNRTFPAHFSLSLYAMCCAFGSVNGEITLTSDLTKRLNWTAIWHFWR